MNSTNSRPSRSNRISVKTTPCRSHNWCFGFNYIIMQTDAFLYMYLPPTSANRGCRAVPTRFITHVEGHMFCITLSVRYTVMLEITVENFHYRFPLFII